MKALQIINPGAPVIIDIPVPEPGPGQVLVRVLAVSTCPHWDLHILGGEPMFPGVPIQYPYTPGQPGHEACGDIAALGEGVTGLKEGQRVCVWCDQGHHRQGCYAEYVVAEAVNVIPVPETMPPGDCAPLELGMCVSAHVMLAETLGAIAGKRVGVFGLGPAGLVCVQLLRAAGAAEVIGFDPVAQRRDIAMSLGAAKALDPASPEAVNFPRRYAPGCLDTAFDCAGKAAAVQHAMDLTIRLVVLFAVQREPYVYQPAHWGGLILAGAQAHSREAAEYAAARLVSGRLNLHPLVTHILPMSDYAKGVELLRKGEAVKVVFTMG